MTELTLVGAGIVIGVGTCMALHSLSVTLEHLDDEHGEGL